MTRNALPKEQWVNVTAFEDDDGNKKVRNDPLTTEDFEMIALSIVKQN